MRLCFPADSIQPGDRKTTERVRKGVCVSAMVAGGSSSVRELPQIWISPAKSAYGKRFVDMIAGSVD